MVGVMKRYRNVVPLEIVFFVSVLSDQVEAVKLNVLAVSYADWDRWVFHCT